MIDNNNNNNLSTLFYKVWKNIYIKGLIIDQIRIYNIYKFKRVPEKENELKGIEAQYYRHLLLYGDNLNEYINNLPSSVNTIEFASNRNGYRRPINLKLLPSTVTSLKFNKSDTECQIDCSDHIHNLEIIPNTIKSISIGKIHYEFLNKGLTYLDVGGISFNCNLVSPLPRNLTTFKCNSTLLSTFNLDLLPLESITNLDFSGSGLIKFELTSNVGSNLSKFVNLTSLNLGNSYKECIVKGSLPNGLKVLKLSNDYNIKSGLSIGSIPDSVTCLNFEPLKLNNTQTSYPQRELCKLSSKLLPCSLVKLGIGRNHYLSLSLKSQSNKSSNLKDFIKIIISGSGFNKSELPKSITSLKYINLSANIYSTPILVIPTHIQSISTNGNFRIINSKDLKNLTNLKCLNGGDLKSCFNENMPLKSLVCNSLLPSQINIMKNNLLTSLSIHINDNGSYKYPQSLTILELLPKSEYQIDTDKFPSSIHTLIINGTTTDIKLPISSNIKSLYISSNNIKLLNTLNPIENINILSILKVYDGNNGKSIFNKLTKQM